MAELLPSQGWPPHLVLVSALRFPELQDGHSIPATSHPNLTARLLFSALFSMLTLSHYGRFKELHLLTKPGS